MGQVQKVRAVKALKSCASTATATSASAYLVFGYTSSVRRKRSRAINTNEKEEESARGEWKGLWVGQVIREMPYAKSCSSFMEKSKTQAEAEAAAESGSGKGGRGSGERQRQWQRHARHSRKRLTTYERHLIRQADQQ